MNKKITRVNLPVVHYTPELEDLPMLKNLISQLEKKDVIGYFFDDVDDESICFF